MWSRGTRTIKGERNLYIELQKHKLRQIAARNKRISLDKRNISLEVKLAVSAVHSKRHILSLKSKFLEILKHILQ